MSPVRCEVKGVFVATNDETTVPLVLLTNGSRYSLPVFIGLWEAVSINSALNREVLARPFTHDLFLDLLKKFSITLHSLHIDSIEGGVYYAQLTLSAGSHEEPVVGLAVSTLTCLLTSICVLPARSVEWYTSVWSPCGITTGAE